MNIVTRYGNWLQKGNSTGVPDRLPELSARFETSVPGIYCAGDLIGIPLIKPAANSGFEVIETMRTDASFAALPLKADGQSDYDIIIAGAGPAGVAAAMRVHELGYRYLVIESARAFSTIHNFPKGKPIYVTPAATPFTSGLHFTDGTKETLLDQLREQYGKYPLSIHEHETVADIQKNHHGFTVITDLGTYTAQRILVAIGKTGTSRKLAVPGAELPKVFTRVIDPGEHSGRKIMVVGGGDSAIEASVAFAKSGNKVTLSYRNDSFSRVKERNRSDFDDLVARNAITPLFNSVVKKIDERTVTLTQADNDAIIENDFVYTQIGTEIPLNFFKRLHIKIAGQKNTLDYALLVCMLLFTCVIYFGKAGPITVVHNFKESLALPFRFLTMHSIQGMEGLFAFLGCCLLVPLGIALLFSMMNNRKMYVHTPWAIFKGSYFVLAVAGFVAVYLSNNLYGSMPLGKPPDFWYSFLYTVTMLIFGVRRIAWHPTGYILRQTIVVVSIQVLLLFLMPFFIFPWLGSHGYLGPWVMQNVFPGGSYWRSFGFILAWPLFIANCATGQPVFFWLCLSLLQSFVIIPALVYWWGKGAYCGWLCPCGGMAETLGDEYRTKASHGEAAKRMENTGQIVLLFAFFVTFLSLAEFHVTLMHSASLWSQHTYTFLIDTLCAGVVGAGVYFFLSGRLWCRFLCPLAALMHIYARFSRYRIMANKKRCISCNICTKVCHMGIDVMNYANKGIPMNDVECVRCSACIINCPLQVLTFGNVDRTDRGFTPHRHYPLTPGWQSGLPGHLIVMLLEEEKNQRIHS